MRREQVVHDDKVDLLAVRDLDPVESVELGEQGVRVPLDVLVVVAEDHAQPLVLAVMDRFDDVLVVAGEVEEAAALARRAEFGKDVLARQGHEVVPGIQFERRP